ncbi:hypothetical protein F5148DRAFT_973340 [Russula earlei]|uniref:Uncharacterized protein n=1 Tax=Russula earlei TaxID=71964 RepID=A0ACC0ULI7_9AGAM|nr:hypothetical protein F5148DRAFT_973340 [Russula earlei]
MDYDIFREELAIKYPTYGHALWEPSPGGNHTVEIGDVGFIREGYFHRLLNILPASNESDRDGVAQHDELPTNIGALPPNNLRSNEVQDRTDDHRRLAAGSQDSLSLSSYRPDDAAQLSFSCFRRRGAILSLPVTAQRRDTAAKGFFAKWILKHIDEWFALARERGLGISREDIILVTGRHLARSWANIVFQESQREEHVSFGVRVSGDSNVEWQFTPEGARGVALNLGPSGQVRRCTFFLSSMQSQAVF